MLSPHPDLDTVLSSLTARERQIVEYVAAGRANKVIAIDLGISLRTVEAHRARIFAKLDARNAMQLACRLCAHARSGASPVPGALSAARHPPPDRAAIETRVLHEPVGAYETCAVAPSEISPGGAHPPGSRSESSPDAVPK